MFVSKHIRLSVNQTLLNLGFQLMTRPRLPPPLEMPKHISKHMGLHLGHELSFKTNFKLKSTL